LEHKRLSGESRIAANKLEKAQDELKLVNVQLQEKTAKAKGKFIF